MSERRIDVDCALSRALGLVKHLLYRNEIAISLPFSRAKSEQRVLENLQGEIEAARKGFREYISREHSTGYPTGNDVDFGVSME